MSRGPDRGPGGTGRAGREQRRRPMWQALLGFELPLPAKFILAFVVLLALFAALFWGLRRFGGSALGRSSGLRGRQPRLAVIDAAAVDARRKLVLIRRDNVEHLIMI